MVTTAGSYFATVSPVSGEVLKEFEPLGGAAVDGAVGVAHAAFEDWHLAPVVERARIVGRAGEIVLELGGSDPFVVLDGDRLERTVDAAAKGRLSNTGQSRVASKRCDRFAAGGQIGGLGGSVFSSDLERARHVAGRIASGMVFVNKKLVFGVAPDAPVGGFSG